MDQHPTDIERTEPASSWNVWRFAILVLGLNLWVSFLLLPVLHLERSQAQTPLLLLVLGTPAPLLIGIWARHPLLLSGLYPALLLLPTAIEPQLVGVNVYTGWTLVLVTLSFLAYMLTAPLLLRLAAAAPRPLASRSLREPPRDGTWPRRLRMYRWLAGLAGLFPAVLFASLYLHPGTREAITRSYPGRFGEALSLFGILVFALWLGLFRTYFVAPLRAHAQSDPQLRYELQQVRREAFRRRPGAAFFIWVVAALILMALLLVAHW